MPTLRSGKPQTETLITTKKRNKHGKRKQSHTEADELENGNPRLATENDPTQRESNEITHISADDGNQEMLMLAAAAEAAVPAGERHTEWPIKVIGRLGLTGTKSGRPYEVTRSEILRRTGQPEHLSGSALCQYLKRRRQATELPPEIVLPKKKTKSSSSLFTLLTEGEASALSQDFGEITRQEKFFHRLGQHIDPEIKQAMRDGMIQLMEALDAVDGEHCNASLRQHGFLVPAVRQVFKQLHEGLQE